MTRPPVRIGCGAGFAEDRIDPARDLAVRGNLDYLVFECLAERTIALAHLDRLADPDRGFIPGLEQRMRAVLEPCARRGTKIVTNMGAANPAAAARRVRQLASELGLRGLRVAEITGDEVTEVLRRERVVLPDGCRVDERTGDRLVASNAYLGCEPIVDALGAGADVVVTGRVADPSLFLAPLVYEHGWDLTDWDRLARGTAVGHLLECAGQVTGGYFADPPHKLVPDLARLGFPFAEVDHEGGFIVSKLPGTGGRVTVPTCIEQLLYEVHDPDAYVTPDVIANFAAAAFAEVAPDVVAVSGVVGRARPETLKVSVATRAGWIGEGQISYAGTGAVERGRLALEVVAERLSMLGVMPEALRLDLIGVDAIHPRGPGGDLDGLREVRVRVAGRCDQMSDAEQIGAEVVALWLNGPAGGAGATRRIAPVIAVDAVYIDRALVAPRVEIRAAT